MIKIPIRRISREEAIRNAHAIMEDGRFKACQKKLAQGCKGCCQNGTILFEEEEPEVVPDGVQIINGRVLNCLDPKRGCRFPKRQKPLVCTLAPIVAGAFIEEEQKLIMFLDQSNSRRCAVNVPDDFRERVNRVIFQLVLGGIWQNNHAIMREDPMIIFKR